MPRGSARFAALVTGLLAGLLVVPAPSQAAGPLRVLLEGDSLTQGFNGDFTWRYRFAKELARQGVNVDLVGSRRGPYVKAPYTSSSYVDPNFDSDHFAEVGSTLLQHANWIDDEIDRVDPDVVVLAAGVNDLRHGTMPADVDTRLRQWIANARSAKSNIRIIVSPVLDAVDATRPWLPQRIRDFRALEAATVAQLSTSQSPISIADTNRSWSPSAYTFDNLHPTPTGETLIAQRIAERFYTLGLLPQVPSIFKPTVWTRVARVQARAVGRRVTLTWDQQAVTGVRIKTRRPDGSILAPKAINGRGTLTTAALRPGTYAFSVQYVRGRMTSPYGPWSTMRIGVGNPPAAVLSVVINKRGVRWSRSPSATSYVVRYRKFNRSRWVTRRTTGLSIRAKRVKEARVRAVNASGLSPVRIARR